MTRQVRGGSASRAAAVTFAYDVFIVHADADESFVQGFLLAKLGLAPERVFVLKAMVLGKFITDEIERGVRSSRVSIVVLSPAYMADDWALFAEHLVTCASVDKRTHGVLLPLLLEDCEIPAHIRALVKLDFRDPTREVWTAEIDRLRQYLAQRRVPDPDIPCPYPGMRPFTEQDAQLFFGRDAELDDVVRRLRRGEREIYVIGASGSGKSSMIAAGLTPMLARGAPGLASFLVRTLRPGERPSAQLADVLEGDIAAPVSAVAQLLARHASATSLLLVIDQLEELFAVAGADERCRFLAAMRALRTDRRCVLMFSLRADFYGAFMESTLWTDLDGRISRVELSALRGNNLRMVIERPARDIGVYFQPELVSRLLEDAAREPGALPLLQEALVQLWGKRRQRLLALADYQALGDGSRTGLAFAISEHADAVLRSLTQAEETLALRTLLRLVAFGEGRADTRRQQPYAALRSKGATKFGAVLQHLVDNRLVTVTGDDQCGDVRVDLAHETLIHAWSTFAEWIRTWRAHEQRRRELEAAAAAWRVRGSGEGGLLDAVELGGAIAWRERAAQQLGYTADLAAFLAASEAAEAHAIRRRRRHRAQRNRMLAESSQLYQETGRQRLVEAERPLEALPYLVAARKATEAAGGSPSSSLRMLFAAATRNLPVGPALRHQGSVVSASFSPDGTCVVTSSNDMTARVWNAATSDALSPPLEHQGAVVGAAFNVDGTRVITASEDRTACVWNVATGEPLSRPLEHRNSVASAAFSPDGTRVVTASADQTARIWDASGEPLSLPLEHQDAVYRAAFSPDGTRVVTASGDQTACVWDGATGEPLSPPLEHQDTVHGAAFSPDGARVVTASADRTARVWHAATGKPLSPPLVHQDTVFVATFSPDGGRVVTASADHTARVWDAATGKPLSPPLEHQGFVVSAAFSPDGDRVVTASADHTARVWDAATGKPLSPWLEHQGAVYCAAFSCDGARIVTASWDQTARVWVAAATKPLSPSLKHERLMVGLAFSPDGTRIVTAIDDQTARVWVAATGEPLSPPLRHKGFVASAAFSPDGTRVVTASDDRTARVWDAATGKPLSPPFEHEGFVVSVAFSPDGNHVVTTSADHTARIWDAVGDALSSPLEHQDTVCGAAFSSDGARVVTASADHTARVWHTATGHPLSPPLEHHDTVCSAAFSPDGTRVVTASADHTARVWDIATGHPLSPPLEHQGTVWSAAFSTDGTRIVTGSGDNTARVWDAATGKPLIPPLQHHTTVVSAEFSADDSGVATATDDNTAHVWDLPLASGTLEEWRAVADQASPYVLANGVLSPRPPRG